MSGYLAVFLILLLGYLFGAVRIGGVQVGSAGVLLVALVFGHFGAEVPASLRDLGLISFVTAVGLYSGPVFFQSIRRKSLVYLAVGAGIPLSAALLSVLAIRLGGMDAPLVLGILTGALTSTPGLAAALEATGDAMVSVGYGIAYPFGVVAVVLFVQLAPKLFRASVVTPAAGAAGAAAGTAAEPGYRQLDHLGLAAFCLTALLGVLLGKVQIPLPAGLTFSLGLSGGPLFAGLFLGHFGHCGPFSLRTPKPVLDVLRECGLVLFLLSAGVEAGHGFVEVLRTHGLPLFLVGAAITVVPMLLGFAIAFYLFKQDMRTTLGAICGGMTSTPSLGTLLSMTRGHKQASEEVSVAYSGAYPVALILVVITTRVLGAFF